MHKNGQCSLDNDITTYFCRVSNKFSLFNILYNLKKPEPAM